MDIKDYTRKIANLKQHIPTRLTDEVYPDAVKKAERAMKRRIFKDGLDSNNESIGEYSQKPITVTKKVLVKKSAFKGNKKSMRLPHGYKELKQIQSLEYNKVNLEYSGDLKRSIVSHRKGRGYAIGFNSRNTKRIARKLEKKYSSKIFKFTEDEKINLHQEVARGLRRITKDYFYAN